MRIEVKILTARLNYGVTLVRIEILRLWYWEVGGWFDLGSFFEISKNFSKIPIKFFIFV